MAELKKVSTEKAPAAIGPYSQAIVCGDMVFTSGQIGIDPTCGEITGKDVREQTEQVMQNLCAVLAEAGTSMENVVKTTCFLAMLYIGYSMDADRLVSNLASKPVSSNNSRNAVCSSVSPTSMCPFGILQHFE